MSWDRLKCPWDQRVLGNGTGNVSFCEMAINSIINSHDHMDSVTKCSASCMWMHILKLNECHISSTFDCILCIYIHTVKVIKLTEYVTKWRGLNITKSGLRFPVLVMCRCFQAVCFPHYISLANRNGFLVHKTKVALIVVGCNGTNLARRKVKSDEHMLVMDF